MLPYTQNIYQPQPIQTRNIGIIWIQGIEGAKAYQIPPNTSVLLMDSENENVFYIKTSDNVGMCAMRYFKYEEIQSSPTVPTIDMSEYVKKADLENMIKTIIGGMTNEQSVSTAKSGKTSTK